MPSCSAFNCTNGSRSAKHQFQLFRFPLNEKKRLAQWVAKVRRKDWVPSSNSRLCAAHFAEECFLVKGGKQSLTPLAIPTIFDYSLKGQFVSAQKSPTIAFTALITGKDHTYASKFENVELTEDKVIEFDQHTQSSIFDTSSDMSSTHEPQHSSPPKTAVALHSTSQVHLLEDGNTGVDELHIQDSELTQDSDIDKLQFSPQITSLVQSAITLDHQYVAGDIQESELTQDSDIDKLQFSPQIRHFVKSSISKEHNYRISESPKSAKRKTETQLDHCRKRLRTEKQKTKRLKKTIHSLSAVIEELKDKRLISTGCSEMMENSFSGVTKEIITRMEKGNKSKVSEELQCFALTLHFYSAKAYSYVRECFNLALPHPDTIRKWYSEVSSDPGFTKASFVALRAHVQKRQQLRKETLCALMMDEMAIRKHIEYSAGRFHGYVDLGCGIVDDSLPPARDALVIMVVAIDDSWKLPVAYFFIDSLTGEERANIVSECLCRLHNVGVRIVSLTCDGPSCHFSMLKALGADLDVLLCGPPFHIRPVSLQFMYFWMCVTW
ncbi:unnamed protein product [Knipowitschia caucasica]